MQKVWYKLRLTKNFLNKEKSLHLKVLTQGFLGIYYWKDVYVVSGIYHLISQIAAQNRCLMIYEKYCKKNNTDIYLGYTKN